MSCSGVRLIGEMASLSVSAYCLAYLFSGFLGRLDTEGSVMDGRPKTIDEFADKLRRAYFEDPKDDQLLLWDNMHPVVQSRWRRVAQQAAEFTGAYLTP